MDYFIGAKLLGIDFVNTKCEKKAYLICKTESQEKGPGFDTEEGDIMFVQFMTDKGPLEIAVYNAHNGYYCHSVRLVSNQISHKTSI